TCLNVGCIPSKALLSVSEKFHEARHAFADFGITCRPKIDIAAMQAHKAAVVEANVKGIAYLFRKNGIDTWHGVASLVAPDRVRVSPPDAASEELRAEAVVIATGSETAALPGLDIDEKTILSSTGALELDRVPKSLAVIGAGVIGLELGSVWRRLGAEVTVIEYLDRILPGMDAEIATLARRELKKQGFDFRLGRKVTEAKRTRNGVVLTTVPANGEGEAETVRAARVLLAVGRRPFTRGLGLEEVGITLDEGGRIPVDENFQTAVPGIYAIGDVIAGPMLAHKAEEEGIAVAEILAGLPGEVDHDVIPAVVYVTPEIAAVGRTEEELAEAGVEYRKGVFRFMANGRARAMGQTAGMVKILADAGSDRVLGAHIAGPMAGELIHEIAVLMAFGGSAEDLARTCHAHPTLSEAVREAAMAAAFGRPVHA
ncbi:MAG TPA: dihydrolipoyl dehydrogenase, partial [Thermopetrobacter sp.]|nr:dihydrolipoyl dehydrogenase [Thermopetrobacter sp.]